MIRVLEILDTLVSFASVTAEPNDDIADFISAFLSKQGAHITKIKSSTTDQYGLVASLGPRSKGGIMLSGHMDVVPVQGQAWTRPAFALTQEDDKVYGRGTTDMKGFLACMLYAAEMASQRSLREPLKLVFSYDEEIGCVGIQQMASALPTALGAPRAGIVGEPTSMRVAVGHKGKIALKASCHGQAGHSALAPRFTNAIDLAADLVVALRSMQFDLAKRGTQDRDYDIPYSTVHVGKITGGRALNIVPETAEVLFELRYLLQDDPDFLHKRVRSLAQDISQTYSDGRIEIMDVTAYPGLDTVQTDPAVSLCQILAQTSEITKVPFGTEAGVFQSLGIPTVVCGPGCMEGQGHKADEYIELSQLSACTAMMDRLLDTLCTSRS